MPNVHIENVAEFTEQFGLLDHEDDRAALRAEADEYGCFAAFLSSEPSLVVLANGPADERWWELLATTAGWSNFQPVVLPVDGDEGLCAAVSRSAELLNAISTGPWDEVIAWGETAGFQQIAGQTDMALVSLDPTVHRELDSKVVSIEVFKSISGIGRVRVPVSRTCSTDTELIAAMPAGGAGGGSVAIKVPHGVAGYGTEIVGPEWLLTDRNCRRVLDRICIEEPSFAEWPLILQEVVPKRRGLLADLTCDAEVLRSQKVVGRRTAAMLLDGVHYGGAVTLAGTDDSYAVQESMTEFTVAAGDRLAARGDRGWFDIDFVADPTGRLYALEINTRRTGPVVVYSLAEALAERQTDRFVACRDAVRLPRRLSSREAFEVFTTITADCGFPVVPTAFLATDGHVPSLGIAVTGQDMPHAVERLDRVSDALVDEVLTREQH